MSDTAERTNLSHLRHDLRTPINQIIGYSELLIEEAADAGHEDDYGPDLQKIRGAAKTLLNLINDSLDLSKVEAGKMELELASFDIAGSLQGVTQTLPLAIYAEFENKLEVALAISALLVVISAILLVAMKIRIGWTSSPSISPFLSARTRSS